MEPFSEMPTHDPSERRDEDSEELPLGAFVRKHE